jgi:hypothetical protein
MSTPILELGSRSPNMDFNMSCGGHTCSKRPVLKQILVPKDAHFIISKNHVHSKYTLKIPYLLVFVFLGVVKIKQYTYNFKDINTRDKMYT